MDTSIRSNQLRVYRKFIQLSCIFLILLLGVEICSGKFLQGKTLPDSEWNVTLNGESTSLAPGMALFPVPKRGDVIYCTAILPKTGFSYPALIFESVRGGITVTNGSRTLYASVPSEDDPRTLIEQISLKDADFSQPVTVTFTISESNSMFNIPNIVCAEQRNGFSSFIMSRGLTFITALFLFFLGVIGTIICSASIFVGKKLSPLITISQFTFWSSICMFCHLGFILLFIPNETVNSILELASFYIALFFVCLIIYPNLLTSKKKKKLFRILTLVYLAYCLISLILPLFTSLRVLDTFSVTLTIIFPVLGCSVFLCLYQWKKRPAMMSFPITGFIVLTGYALFEELRVALHSLGIYFLGTPEMLILCAGILIFTASSLIDYFVWFKESTIQETVEESWKRFSEPNSKPGISGYQKTLALLKEFEDSKAQYTVATISIDNVDELMLCVTPYPMLEDNFARLLHLVFSSYGITGNMGNGKFIVAVPDMPEGKMKQLLRAFKELVRRDNENHPDAKIVFSYGYALSTDSDDEEIVKICQLANNSRQVQEQQLLQ